LSFIIRNWLLGCFLAGKKDLPALILLRNIDFMAFIQSNAGIAGP